MKIENAMGYFEHVIVFNLAQYKAQSDFLPAAFNLANSLFSMYEWMWVTYGRAFGGSINSKKDYIAYLHEACPSFGHIRDLANASKHVFLKTPSTQATQITCTTAVESRFGEGRYGVSKYARGVVVIDDGGTKIDFERVADEVYEFWLAELGRVG